jgi:hypothetical protein
VNNEAILSWNRWQARQAAGNYPDPYGLGQNFANDYGRAEDEYARRVKREQAERLAVRRKCSRERGYRPSRRLA